MTNQEVDELIEAMERHRIKNTKTPEDAIRYLQSMGLLDENGDLAEPYKSSLKPLDDTEAV